MCANSTLDILWKGLIRANSSGAASAKRIYTILPVLIGLTALLWLRPFNTFIFGQDSFLLPLPFTVNSNPLASFNYTLSPVNLVADQQPYFYVMLFYSLIEQLGISPQIAERVLVMIGNIIGSTGVFYFLGTINEVNGRSRTHNVFGIALATLVYLYNPATLSMVWWRYENWVFFYLYIPYLSGLFISLYYKEHLPLREFSLVAIMGILLAPGVNSSFAASIFFASFAILILLVIRAVFTRDLAASFKKILVLILLDTILVSWVLIPPLVALFQNSHSGFGNYLSPLSFSATVQAFYGSGSPLLRILGLDGFSWIASVPSAYPWIGYLPLLEVFSTLSTIIFIFSSTYIPKVKGPLLIHITG